VRTKRSQGNTPGLRLVGKEESGSASTIYGPVRAGLTTPQRTDKEVPLTELLSFLEREVETLESRYSEVLDTLTTATERLVRLTDFILETSTTKEDK
jgi:hypothetical protein